MGVRKRGGARRGRGVFPAVRVWDQQHGRGWRRAGSGCAARTNRGSERHGALPGGSQGAPGRARPCSQPGSGAGAAPAARGGAWTPPRRTETSPGAARPRCSPGRTRSAAPNTAGPPRSHAGPAARGSAASPAGPDSLPTRGPLRSAPILRPPPRPHGGPAPKSFQVREPQLYRGRAGLGWWRPPWLRSAPPLCPVPRRKWALPAPPRPARPLFPAPPAAPPPRPAGTARPQVRDGGDGTGPGGSRAPRPGPGVPSARAGHPETAQAPQRCLAQLPVRLGPSLRAPTGSLPSQPSTGRPQPRILGCHFRGRINNFDLKICPCSPKHSIPRVFGERGVMDAGV